MSQATLVVAEPPTIPFDRAGEWACGCQRGRCAGQNAMTTDTVSRPPDPARRWRLAVAAAGIWAVGYLGWRVGWTLSGASPLFGAILLIAEVVLMTQFALDESAALVPRGSPPATGRRPDTSASAQVFVVAGDESAIDLRAALIAARRVSTDHPPLLLDPADRPDTRSLALDLGLPRRAGRAGETDLLNAALVTADAELVVLQRGDEVLAPWAVTAVVDHFDDPTVGAVVLQRLPDDDQLASRDPVAPTSRPSTRDRARAGAGGCLWTTQPAVLRRVALMAVGGFASPEPRLGTDVRLRQAGWWIAAGGPASWRPTTEPGWRSVLVEEARIVRLARGALRPSIAGLGASRLAVAARAALWASAMRPLTAVARLVIVLVPMTVALTGWLPLRASALGLALAWGPLLTFSGLASRWGERSRPPVAVRWRRSARLLAADLLALRVDPRPSRRSRVGALLVRRQVEVLLLVVAATVVTVVALHTPLQLAHPPALAHAVVLALTALHAFVVAEAQRALRFAGADAPVSLRAVDAPNVYVGPGVDVVGAAGVLVDVVVPDDADRVRLVWRNEVGALREDVVPARWAATALEDGECWLLFDGGTSEARDTVLFYVTLGHLLERHTGIEVLPSLLAVEPERPMG